MGRSYGWSSPDRPAIPLDPRQQRLRQGARVLLWLLVLASLVHDVQAHALPIAVSAGAAAAFGWCAWRRDSWRTFGGAVDVAAIALVVVTTGGLGSPYEILFLVALVDDAIFQHPRRLILDLVLVVMCQLAILSLVESPPTMTWHDVTWFAFRTLGWGVVLAFVRQSVHHLRITQQRFRSLFENHPDGVSMRDERGRLLEINGALQVMSGLSREAVLAADQWYPRRPIPSSLDPAHREACRRALDGEASSCDTSLVNADGRRLEIRRTYIPITVDGRHAGLFAISHDRTEQRRAELAEQHLAAIVTSAQDAIFSVALDERVTTWNGGAERLLGLVAGQAVGRHLEEVFGREYTLHRDEVIGEILEGRSATFEARLQRWDGTEVDVTTTASPILDTEGVLTGVSVIKRDISEHARAQEFLRRSEQRFRSLADRTQGVVFLADVAPEPRFVYLNDTVEEITGFPAADYLADPTLPTRRAAPGSRLGIARVAEDGDASGVVTYEFQCADGTWRHLEEHYTAVADERGNVVGVQGIVFDVSAREEAHNRLQVALEAEQAAVEQYEAVLGIQEAFIQAVSHELRTPLTVVLGLARTLEEHPELAPELRQRLVGRLSVNAGRLGRLLDDLIDLNRISRNALELAPEPVALVDLCRGVVAEMDTNAHRVFVDGAAVVVPIDRARMERVVDNLVRNAIRHTPPGSNVWVRVEPWGEGAMIAVEDDGPGVPDPLKEAVFEPFRQGPAASHEASPGTGIGLNLVAKFIELHGGRVWVEDRPGGGARFLARIPGPETDGGWGQDALPQAAGQS